jgi:hypothetical protein
MDQIHKIQEVPAAAYVEILPFFNFTSENEVNALFFAGKKGNFEGINPLKNE